MKEFKCIVNGIVIDEDMAMEIAEKYERFCNARDISDNLEIDMDLAEKIAEHYEEKWVTYQDNLYDAVIAYSKLDKGKYDLLREKFLRWWDAEQKRWRN